MRKNHYIIFITCVCMTLCCLSAVFHFQSCDVVTGTADLSSQIENINVLVLVDYNVGDNFLDVRDTLEGWNVSVTTIGRTPSVITHGGTPVIVDKQLSEFNERTDFTNYDMLFVPSGAWWLGVSNDATLTDFIKSTYDHGLIVGSMCVGSGILGAADIVEGKKILVHPNSAYLVTQAGGIYNFGCNVTSDDRIITGDTGSGVSGNQNAPYVQFAEMVIRQILDLSYLVEFKVETVDDLLGSSHRITVTTQTQHELDHTLTGYLRNISQVEIVCYPKNARKSSFTVVLNEIADNVFEGYVNEDITSRCTAKIEIYTDTEELEIVTYGKTLYINVIPGYPLWVLIPIVISLISTLVTLSKKHINKN